MKFFRRLLNILYPEYESLKKENEKLRNQIKILIEEPESEKAKIIIWRYRLGKAMATAYWTEQPIWSGFIGKKNND